MMDNWHHSPPYGFGLGPSSSYSSSSSTRSSHLSILTTPSSVSALSRTSTSSDHPPVSPPSSDEQKFSSGSKTHAFFASPFSADASLPPEPQSAPAAGPSKHSFSDAEVTPRIESAPTSKKSLNDSFFSPSWHTDPLPSSSASDGHSSASSCSVPITPPLAPALTSTVPLSRVFPSRVRYTTVDELPSREGSPQGYPPVWSSPPPPLSTGRRKLVELDPAEYQTTHQIDPAHEVSTSMHPDSSAYTHTPKKLHVLVPMHADSSKLPTPVRVSPLIVESPMSMAANEALPVPALRPGDLIDEPPAVDSVVSMGRDEPEADLKLRLVLVKTLGQGAFSSVWLARDETGRVGKLEVSRKNSLKKQKSKLGSLRRSGSGAGSLRRRVNRTSESSDDGYASEKVVEGTVPKIRALRQEGSDGQVGGESVGVVQGNVGRLVALKMTDRSLCDKDDRTRVSFVREVEVLKHISHPSIVSYIHAFSIPSHHILVLEHVPGGELFDLVSSQETHARLHEILLRRIFGELARAVGWMHAVGLVHRDIKLENILLTRDVFAEPTSPAPLIKLTDFGLSRFIDPSSPLLTTRCGSESYAAPELVTGRPYDGRETDAWACGVVLYALVTRRLPFDAMNPPTESGMRSDVGLSDSREVKGAKRDERSERRALLMRIANGQYTWPDLPQSSSSSPTDGSALRGLDLARSEDLKRVVGRLLVRDPRKRTKVAQLWDDPWMTGEGAPPAPVLSSTLESIGGHIAHGDTAPYGGKDINVSQCDSMEAEEVWDDDAEGDWEFEDEEDDEGVLVDEHNIAGSVACQELVP